MDVTPESSKSFLSLPPAKPRSRRGRWLIGSVVCLTLIVLFYAEENWRGQRAWEDCKRSLQAQGVKLNGADDIPAPVPDDENVFGVPEMRSWFAGGGTSALSIKLSYPGYASNRTARLLLAELTIVPPGGPVPNPGGATVLRWGDPQAKAEAARLFKDALGPLVMDPLDCPFILREPEEVHPAQIFLQCQTRPGDEELLQFLTAPIASAIFSAFGKLKVEPAGHGSYKVTMLAPDTAAAFLKWSGQFEPEFTILREALQRPCVQMDVDDSQPMGSPIPYFVCIRTLVQRLAAMAQCHLLEGKPEEALRDLTLMHDLCRIMEGSRPMTLGPLMMNVAVTGLYANTIADGLLRHAWREPQLAVLEEQLKKIRLLPQAKQAFERQRVSSFHFLESTPPAQFFDVQPPHYSGTNVMKTLKAFILGGIIPRRWTAPVVGRLIPRGWVWQNMAAFAHGHPNPLAGLDPASPILFPDKVDAASRKDQEISSHIWPYTFMVARMAPDFSQAVQRCAQNQATVNQTLVACALERCLLAHGEYPENLDALAPQFIAAIPRDIIDGQSLHYRRAAHGTFILYSIGWNGRDDGGVRGQSFAEGDWVWPVWPP